MEAGGWKLEAAGGELDWKLDAGGRDPWRVDWDASKLARKQALSKARNDRRVPPAATEEPQQAEATGEGTYAYNKPFERSRASGSPKKERTQRGQNQATLGNMHINTLE